MRPTLLILACWSCFPISSTNAGEPPPEPTPLAGTRPLAEDVELASRMVDGIDRFLLRKIDESEAGRARFWSRDFASPERYAASIEPNRRRLAHILGVRDDRPAFDAPELVGTTKKPALLAIASDDTAVEVKYRAYAVRWPAFGDAHGEGLLLLPAGPKIVADVIAIPDADNTPEQLAGLAEGLAPASQFARILAEGGCRVIVPVLIDRRVEARGGRSKLTSREYLYRSAFEMGRHPIGYEVQKVLAAVDWFGKTSGKDAKIGVFGHGEGGLVALAAGALDTRIGAVGVSGAFDDRRDLWREPLDRNVFGLLEQFGDAELASMVAPRTLIIEAAKGPDVVIPPGTGGGPGRLVTPTLEAVREEFRRAKSLVAGLKPSPRLELVVSEQGGGPFGTAEAIQAFLDALSPGAELATPGKSHLTMPAPDDPKARQDRQVYEIDHHNQRLLAESAEVRRKHFAKLDTSSPEAFRKSVEPYRDEFRDEIIGRFADPIVAPDVRSRKVFDGPKYEGYEVEMDVFPDVLAGGILLIPKGLKAGEKRPVVVCQHGLEGRPSDVADTKVNNPAYNQYAVRLAERGFITFAPQNPYIFGDRFRTLQRKANPLKKTLFSIIVPQHRQIVNWLKTLPNVDPERVAFYGLSYGGKTAMRVPPLVEGYCLSICSADFNDWIWKNASTSSPYSYVWTNEYEIFEFDLGNTFNYAEMAALIAPRPFMVERGHFDGVAPDEAVGYEFAKVRNLYEARLGVGDRCLLEWFVGPHTIHGVGTFDFLHRHLDWPKP